MALTKRLEASATGPASNLSRPVTKKKEVPETNRNDVRTPCQRQRGKLGVNEVAESLIV